MEVMKEKTAKKNQESMMTVFKKGFFSTLGKSTAVIIAFAAARKLGLLNFEVTSYKKWCGGYIYKNSKIKKD